MRWKVLPWLAVAGCYCLANSTLWAATPEWPQFRGPHGDGVATVEHAPVTFSETENVTWKTELPGKGWSSPVIADGLAWMTTAVERAATDEEREARLIESGTEAKQFKVRQVAKEIRLLLLAIDIKSGAVRHEQELFRVEDPDPIHALNSYASPTPVIDGERIYCHFGTFGTVCLRRADLQVEWQRRLPLEHSVGPGSSPVISGDLLVLICDGVDRQYVITLNKQTGEPVWQKDRPPMDAPNGDQKKSYSTPILITDTDGRQQLICMSSQWLVSHEPDTGEELWRLRHGTGFSVVPRPVYGAGLVYIATGYGKPQLWAVHVNGHGEISDDKVAWIETRNAPAKPSPLFVGQELYIIDDTGVATCFDAASGEILWKERVPGNYSASPLLADGKIYFASHEGKVTVITAGPDFERIAENQLDGQIMASPVAVDNGLFVRTDKAFYRFDVPASPE